MAPKGDGIPEDRAGAGWWKADEKDSLFWWRHDWPQKTRIT